MVYRCGRRAGFSLSELLVVVAIVAALAGILMPVLGMVRSSARALTCASNLRQIGLAFTGYASDNAGYFPAPKAAYDYPDSFYREWYGPIAVYLDRLAPANYSSGGRSYRCPSSNFGRQNNDFGLSYGFCIGNGGTTAFSALATPVRPLRVAASISETYLLGERWAVNLASLGADWSCDVQPPYVRTPVEGPKRSGFEPSSLRLSHRSKSSYLLLDLHVAVQGPWDHVNKANTGTWAGSQQAPNWWRGMP
jgi:prepilin-type N-terminal cleavage/methylation domain-containing protein